MRRALLMVEPAGGLPGYLLLVDDILPQENPDARCDWFLHPRGELSGDGPSLVWTTWDFLDAPPRPVRLAVDIPREGVERSIKKDAGHICGAPFEPAWYLDASWRGPRRFWAALRPCPEGVRLPCAEPLAGDLGLRLGSDLFLVRPLNADRLACAGAETLAAVVADAAALLVREGAPGFYLAVRGRSASLCGGAVGFEASSEVLITARGTDGAVFVDRPHKQREPMEPVRLVLRHPKIGSGKDILLDDRLIGKSSAGQMAMQIESPGQHRWRLPG